VQGSATGGVQGGAAPGVPAGAQVAHSRQGGAGVLRSTGQALQDHAETSLLLRAYFKRYSTSYTVFSQLDAGTLIKKISSKQVLSFNDNSINWTFNGKPDLKSNN
jgi:hypothetical protein